MIVKSCGKQSQRAVLVGTRKLWSYGGKPDRNSGANRNDVKDEKEGEG